MESNLPAKGLHVLLAGIVAIFVFWAFARAASENLEDPKKASGCEYEDKREPKALQGNHGINGDAYWYRYMSDVESDKLNTFTNMIWNNHQANLLPIEWKDADLEFSELSPGKCGKNSYQSTQGYTTKQMTQLDFGSKLDKHLSTSLYVLKSEAVKPAAFAENPMPLVSSVTANIGTDGFPVAMSLRSSVHGTDYEYSILNRTEQKLAFSITGLTKAWRDLVGREKAERLSDNLLPHIAKDDSYVILPTGNAGFDQSELVMKYRSIGSGGFDEKVFKVKIYKLDAHKVISSGRVSVYVPK